MIRHAIAAGGAALVTNGILSHEQLGEVAGALATIAMIAWSIIQKRQSGKLAKAVETVNAAVQVGAATHLPDPSCLSGQRVVQLANGSPS